MLKNTNLGNFSKIEFFFNTGISGPLCLPNGVSQNVYVSQIRNGGTFLKITLTQSGGGNDH